MTGTQILTLAGLAVAGVALFFLTGPVGARMEASKRNATMPVVVIDLLRIAVVALMRVAGVVLVLVSGCSTVESL